MDDDSRSALVDFIWSVRPDVDVCLRRLVDSSRSQVLRELAEQSRLALESPVVLHAERQMVERVRAGDRDAELDEHGLSGALLALKLRVIQELREFVATALSAVVSQWASLKEQLVSLLKAIDVTLESILDALGGVGGALVETKKGAEVLLEAPDDAPDGLLGAGSPVLGLPGPSGVVSLVELLKRRRL